MDDGGVKHQAGGLVETTAQVFICGGLNQVLVGSKCDWEIQKQVRSSWDPEGGQGLWDTSYSDFSKKNVLPNFFPEWDSLDLASSSKT